MDHAELLTLYQHGVITREELRAAMSWTAHECRRVTEHWTTKDGESIAWADVETRHLWNIARMLSRTARAWQGLYDNPELLRADWLRRMERSHARNIASYGRKMRANIARARNELSMAIDELAYRDALPTWDDLRIAWDRACGGDGGPNVADDPEQRPWCLIELWVGFRGEPTTSAEWEAQRSCSG